MLWDVCSSFFCITAALCPTGCAAPLVVFIRCWFVFLKNVPELLSQQYRRNSSSWTVHVKGAWKLTQFPPYIVMVLCLETSIWLKLPDHISFLGIDYCCWSQYQSTMPWMDVRLHTFLTSAACTLVSIGVPNIPTGQFHNFHQYRQPTRDNTLISHGGLLQILNLLGLNTQDDLLLLLGVAV